MNIVQVEVSTKCQLDCIMCPKSCFGDWIPKNMDMVVFEKIPFKKFKYAHLQGWGEPLLHPKIDEMIEIAKKRCKVGLTTNGLLIDRHVDSLTKLDLIAVSVASADPDVHAAVRKCDLEVIKRNIRLISENRGKTRIVVTTIMMRDTVDGLPKMIDFASECGADEVIANNLDYIPSESLTGLKVFGSKPDRRIGEILEKTRKIAEDVGINFVARPIVMEEALVCAENPIENCLITVDGKISPCVYLHLPTESDRIVRYFEGERVEVPKVYFNSLKDWEKSEIRKIFRRRLSFLPFTEIPPLPNVCRTCYKAYSL